jgi:hypothetical protein
MPRKASLNALHEAEVKLQTEKTLNEESRNHLTTVTKRHETKSTSHYQKKRAFLTQTTDFFLKKSDNNYEEDEMLFFYDCIGALTFTSRLRLTFVNEQMNLGK